MTDGNHEQKAIARRRAIEREALLEMSPFGTDGGEAIGRDPRDMTGEELDSAGIERMTFAKAIRAHCSDCCAYQANEVRKCVAISCNLWPYRFGSNPWRKGEKQNVAGAIADKNNSTGQNREQRAV